MGTMTRKPYRILEDGSFRYSLPKIPVQVSGEILAYFRREMPDEAIVQIWHHPVRGYYVRYPETAYAGMGRISYRFSCRGIGEDDMLIMAVHSHNRMPAFFSPTDDGDELDIPGIYGVIGKVDTEPEMRVRCIEGGDALAVGPEEIFCKGGMIT